MILAGLSMAAVACTGSVWAGARLHGRLARPAGRASCRLPDHLPDGGPL